MKYIFILGNNPELSAAEIRAVLPQAKIIGSAKEYLVLENDKLDYADIMNRLGGTIKIGVVLGSSPDFGPIIGTASSTSGKFKFGVSFYNVKKSNFGMKAKGLLKSKGVNARLVESREPALSSVIVTKEKCQDFLVLPNYFGLTCAVQDFEEYGRRDFGRPAADARSGMLPPKVAKMMINLSGADPSDTILDPFCGSGTILAEAMALGFRKLIGTDVSDKAIADTRKNLEWLVEQLRITNYELRIEKSDIRKLTNKIASETIDAIVTEPFLGQPIKGNEKSETIEKIIKELDALYLETFKVFAKLLKPNGKIVIVIPEWHVSGKIRKMEILPAIPKLGFKRLDSGNLIYKREGQKVWRNITIWEKI